VKKVLRVFDALAQALREVNGMVPTNENDNFDVGDDSSAG
jgi:hypothetical protein